MGSQRRLAQQLRESYSVSEDKAYELVHLIEKIQIEDDLADALCLVETGNPRTGFARLFRLAAQLGSAIIDLDEQIRPLVPRRPS